MSKRHPGSRHHAALNQRRWQAARRAALERAGWRSERSGVAGRLEVHHIIALEDGGDPYDLGNLRVLTREEHIAEHRQQPSTVTEWRRLVGDTVLTT